MKTKQYLDFSNKVRLYIQGWENEVKTGADTINKMLADYRFSEEGKEENREAIIADLNATADKVTADLKEEVLTFCNAFRIVLPEDNANHDMDIANALKVIEMMDKNLTPETVRTILEPVKGSYRNVRLISDTIEARIGYYDNAKEILRALFEFTGRYSKAYEYLDLINQMKAAASDDKKIPHDIIRLGFSIMQVGQLTVELTPDISYSILTIPDNIEKAGKMYEQLHDELSELFTAHIPTAFEITESALK